MTAETPQAKAAKNAARQAAIAKLVARHDLEFADLMNAEHQARGVTWNKRLTPAEKAERAQQAEAEKANQALDALVARYPMLSSRVAPD